MTQFCPGIARNDPACPQIVNTFYYGSLWTILGFCVSFLAIQGNLGPWGKLRNILGHFLGEFLQLHWSSNKWTRMLKWLRSSNGPGKWSRKNTRTSWKQQLFNSLCWLTFYQYLYKLVVLLEYHNRFFPWNTLAIRWKYAEGGVILLLWGIKLFFGVWQYWLD